MSVIRSSLFLASSPTTGASPVYQTEAYTNPGGSGTSNVVTMPSGVTTGDLLVAIMLFRGAGAPGTVTMPSGWANLTTAGINGETANCRVDWKISDGTEGASQTWNFTASSGGRGCSCIRISGANSGTPFDSSGFGAEDTVSDNTIPLPSRTPSVTGTLLIAVGMVAGGSLTHSFGSGVTEVRDSTINGGGSLAVGYLTLNNTSPTGVITDTLSTTSTTKIGFTAVVRF